MTDESEAPVLRGFAALTPERRRELARMGGLAVPAERRAYSQDRDLARRAGQLGGRAIPAEKRSYSVNRQLAVDAGRKGGRVRKVPA